jgi:hypothetical protein
VSSGLIKTDGAILDIRPDEGTMKLHRRQTRVFYINTGNMAPIKAKAYLASIKEEIGHDSVYYENFFIAVNDRDSKIEVFP